MSETPMTPEREREIRSLDLLELMSERSAAVVSGHLAALLGETSRLRARVAELEAEREKLIRWHGEDSKTIAKLEAQRDRRRVRLIAAEADLLAVRGLLSPAGERRRIPAEIEIHERVAPAVEWLLDRVAELKAERHSTNEALSDAAEALREMRDRLAEYERPADEDPIRYTLTDKAVNAPAALRAEDTADILTLAPAQHADAQYNAVFQTIELELTATPEQWATWQKALTVDLARTTNRGACVTSHATWRGIHVVVRCWLVKPETGGDR
jgi:hypothetical protein